MYSFNEVKEKKGIIHNPKCPCLVDHPHSILIVCDLGTGNGKALLNIFSEEHAIQKTLLVRKRPIWTHISVFTNRRKSNSKKYVNISNVLNVSKYVKCVYWIPKWYYWYS